MNRESQLLLTNEPVEFEKYLVEFQDFRKITDHSRGNLWNISQFYEKH
jgi:hypothetical protein